MYDLPRIPLPTTASSADLSRIPASILQQALFSARLNLTDPLAQIGASIKGILDGDKSLSESRRDIRASLFAAGYTPPEGAEGGLLDHTSRTRLDLILGQNVRFARGFGWFAAGMDPDALRVYPAQEFVRLYARKVPRTTWRMRWLEAGGKLFGRRMIALKTSPVWENLSVFDLPYPPFDFGSGMGVIDIPRAEAVSLGVLADDDDLTPQNIPFPETAEANLPDISSIPALQEAIAKIFGAGAKFEDGVLTLAKTLDLPVRGTAAELSLPKLGTSTVQPAPPNVTPAEARNLIESGQASVRDPSDNLVRFPPKVFDHWLRDKPDEIDNRLARIRQAFDTVRSPQEVWERDGTRWYMREFADDGSGKPRRMLVQVDGDNNVITWIPSSKKPRYFERKREGTLLVKEGAL